MFIDHKSKSENRFIVKASGLLVLTWFMWSMFLFRLSVGVWEDRAVLARLKEKLQTEDGRLVLRIEQEEWKVTSSQVADG